jgi:serine/threonine-protein kinase
MMQPGSLFAHFKIISKSGEGGMGQVFLAEDTKLNRNVALKILNSDMFDDAERKERFLREARTAAQISHPSVMNIHDIGMDRDEDGRELNYIVMEHVSGRSLSETLRSGELSLKDSVRIAEKIASGLAAAHRLNIVHRDIKADNIIIDEAGEPRILDFGLAKPVEPVGMQTDSDSTDTVSQELTKAGKIIGTVSYMSPEQAQGGKIDVRSDVFSFGILFYRMVTGKLPFEGPTSVSTLAKILESQPEPPSTENAAIPPGIERIIDKCLQKNPGDRYQGASDLVVDLRAERRRFDSGITESITGVTAAQSRTVIVRLGKGWTIGIAAALIAALALIVALFDQESGSSSSGLRAGENSLAILGFENKTGDEEFAWLETGLPEILLTDLAQTPSLKIIGRERILDCFPDRRETHTFAECVDAAQTLGAAKLLTGSFYKVGQGQIRIDARLQEVATGNIVLAEKVIGDDPFSLVDSLTRKLAASLNIVRDESREGVTHYTSSSPEAYKLYLVGLELMLNESHDEAREKFQQALAIDSSFALPYMRLGMSYTFQQRPQQGVPYFEKARQFEDKLPLRDRSLLDAYVDFWLEANWDDGYVKLTSFVRNYPDDKEGRAIYGLVLSAFTRDSALAFAQLDTALQLDPRYQFALSGVIQVARQNGNMDKAIEYAERVRDYHPDAPVSYIELGNLYSSARRIDEALAEFRSLNQKFPNSYAVALESLSDLFIFKRMFDSSRYYLEELRERSSGDPYNLRTYYSGLANLANWRGKLRENLEYRFKAVNEVKRSRDSAAIYSAYGSVSAYYRRIGMVDSSLYYSQLAHSWANSLSRISYPVDLLRYDRSRADEAIALFDTEVEELRKKLPSDLWPIMQGLDDMMQAEYQVDSAALLVAYDEFNEFLNSQPNSGNIREMAILHYKLGNHAKAKELLLNFVQGQYQSGNGYVFCECLYYLGKSNEGLGLTEEAVSNYSDMLHYWSEPDVEIEIITDARARLAALTS